MVMISIVDSLNENHQALRTNALMRTSLNQTGKDLSVELRRNLRAQPSAAEKDFFGESRCLRCFSAKNLFAFLQRFHL
jgi:hypothetical protein